MLSRHLSMPRALLMGVTVMVLVSGAVLVEAQERSSRRVKSPSQRLSELEERVKDLEDEVARLEKEKAEAKAVADSEPFF